MFSQMETIALALVSHQLQLTGILEENFSAIIEVELYCQVRSLPPFNPSEAINIPVLYDWLCIHHDRVYTVRDNVTSISP